MSTITSHSLEPRVVRQVIDAKLNGQPFDAAQFLFYHLHRNHFNVGAEVTSLRRVGDDRFVDNLGKVWTEMSVLKNFFHMPTGNWLGSNLGLTTAYSRKFLRDDNETGVGGEFEMIIRKDGKRIDALTHEKFQETYNFGRTRNMRAHKLLDVDTHNANGQYTYKVGTGRVTITD